MQISVKVLRPERQKARMPTDLYREIRFEGQVRGTGMFAKGIVPRTKFRLVLQGNGNWCLTAEDFYRWNLRISGPKAGYTIYGYFAKPSPEPNRQIGQHQSGRAKVSLTHSKSFGGPLMLTARRGNAE